MTSHPLRLFIDELFPSKEEAKRSQWANFLIDQEYDEIDQLKDLTEEEWKTISSTIPMKIVSAIKKKLNEDRKDEEMQSKREVLLQKNDEKLQMQGLQIEHKIQSSKEKSLHHEKIPEDDGKLTSEDKMQLSEYLNEGLSTKQILKFFRVVEGSPKGNAILLEIKSLMKPPKPEPQGCKRVGVKLNQQALPLFLYRGKKLQLTKYYTLLVVGETGSGKTTLLDAFVNKLTGMEFTDNWRWKLVNEDHLKNVPSGSSQTSEITTYYINDVNNRFNIRIIDTPGFGDTKGLQVDDQTVKKFESLFNTISEIDYVLLTVKATETRLKAGSKYVYNRVEQIFGVDAKDRFILMCTFAEGAIPLCVETFQKEKLHFDKYFPFNNSAIYVPSGHSNPTTHFFWKMAISSIQAFEDYIIEADKNPLSLNLSREVLEARKYLEQSIKTSQSSIIDTSKQLDVAKMNLTNWKRNKKQIEQNGQYTKYQTVTTFPYTNLGKTVQMCNVCKITCCQVCQWPPNSIESACTYFSNGRGCPRCPGSCPRSAHVRTNDYIQKVTETKAVVIDCKKQAYEQGVTLEQKFKNDLKKNQENIATLAKTIWHHGTQIKSNLKKLETIALQPKMWTDEDFYNQMITQEEDQRQAGWVERVSYLKETLKRMRTCKKLADTATIDDLFPELKTLKKDMESQSSSSSCEIY